MNPLDLTNKVYLGDGLYAGFDGYQAWLYTESEAGVTNAVALEPQVMRAFLRWVKGITALTDGN